MLAASALEFDLISVAEKLPTAPRLLVELGTVMQQPSCSGEAVVDLLKQDPTLVAQILRMANSAAYAPAEKINDLEHAISFVGFDEIHCLVGAVASEQLAEGKIRYYPVDANRLRRHTLFVAILMETLGNTTQLNPQECYIVGLLRTMGMMALERMVPAIDAILPFECSPQTELHHWEREQWGITNVEAAEIILTHWQLPTKTSAAIRGHCNPEQDENPRTHLLHLAASCAAQRYECIAGEENYWSTDEVVLERNGLTIEELDQACDRAAERYRKLRVAID